jgi:hypothetical protein
MVPCGCSLRSTQCAALIALATAAGIVRLDSARAAISPAADAYKPTTVDARMEHRIEPSRYQVALQVLAPWLRVFGISIQTSASASPALVVAALASSQTAADHESHYFGPPATGPVPSVAVDSEIDRSNVFAWVAPAPTARHHAIPFAVGPPATETHSSDLRVIGTAVPGDLIARWMSVSSIAVSFVSISDAPVVCAKSPSHSLAGSNFPLSSALRGEPVPASSLALSFSRSRAAFAYASAGTALFRSLHSS